MKKTLTLFLLAAICFQTFAAETLRYFHGADEVVGETHTLYGGGSISMTGYPSGRIYVTTNGEPPTVLSPQYTGPIALSTTTRLRAVAHNADFTASAERDVLITVLPVYQVRVSGLTSLAEVATNDAPFRAVTSYANGIIPVASNQLIRLRAREADGWFFEKWKGFNGSEEMTHEFTVKHSQEIRLSMYRTNELARAFANGSVVAWPGPPYFSDTNYVQLSAVPNEGYFFAGWVDDTSTPISYWQRSEQPSKTPQFAPLPPNSYSLTVIIEGIGTLTSPSEFVYTAGEVATISVGTTNEWVFREWSGGSQSTNSTISVTMNSDMVLTAHLSRLPIWASSVTAKIWGGLAVGLDERVYVTAGDAGGPVILRAFNSDGLYDWETRFGDVSDQFGGVAVGPDGTLFVPAPPDQLNAFSSSGNFLWKKKLPQKMTFAVGDDSLYVISGGSLQRLSFDGSILQELNNAITVSFSPSVFLDSHNRLRVSGLQIKAFSPTLEPLWSVQQQASALIIDTNGSTFFSSIEGKLGAVDLEGQMLNGSWLQNTGTVKSLGLNRLHILDSDERGLATRYERLAALDKQAERIWHSANFFRGGGPIMVATTSENAVIATYRGKLRKHQADGALAWERPFPDYTGAFTLAPNGMLYYGWSEGGPLYGHYVGDVPAASGWPLPGADWRNSRKASIGPLKEITLNKLTAERTSSGVRLTFVASGAEELALQWTEDFVTWHTETTFSPSLDYAITSAASGARFYRVKSVE